MRNLKLLSTVLGLISLGSIACGSGTQASDDDGYNGTVSPGSGDSSGNGSAAPDAAVPPGCDVSKTPSQDACVVNETLGVFVAPASDDAGADAAPDGTRGHPFSKMQDAIDAAKTAKKRVYACVGSYSEQITIADGVSMFGDLDCNQAWSVSGKHASVNAPASPAARADQITTATRIEAVDLMAPDGTADLQSSTALIATESPALVIASATIHAGKGARGADGIEELQLANDASANGADNSNALLENCSAFSQNPVPCATRHRTVSAGGTNACGGRWHSTIAGSGGNGGTAIGDAVIASGTTFFEFGNQYYMTPAYLATSGNAAGAAAGGVPGSGLNAAGANGANGAPGSNGMSASGIGKIDAVGFRTSDGIQGANGSVGQGGGGGSGYDYVTESSTSFPTGNAIYFTNGGGGGAGGCPGLSGSAGGGGGASIAIIAIDSPMTLDNCNVQASDAGDGGKGTFGTSPTAGGAGGSDLDPGACNPIAVNCLTNHHSHHGGAGGAGGDSGWSGSGAGGSSIGVAYHGAQVVLVSTVPSNGSAGHGVGALTLSAKTIPASPDGASGLSLSF